MKKNFIALLAASATLASSATFAYADEKDDRIAELESQVDEMQTTIDELQSIIDELKAELEKYSSSSDQDSYGIGDTWTVAGQWALTIDSVEEVADRNQFSDKTPEAVYLITYTYENLGYKDDLGIMNGVYIDLSSGQIVDADGKMGYSYPGDITFYPQETPIDAKCEAQACIGVGTAGNFKIHFSKYDGNTEEQDAVFSIVFDQDEVETSAEVE